MATLQNYARLKVYFDSGQLEQITSIQHSTASGNQAVDLLTEGLGGFTDGSGRCTLEIGFAVPLGGSEYPFQEKCAKKEFVTVQLISGAQQYVGVGKIEETNISQSANANLEGTCSWIGELAAFEGGL